jgi:8-amino-7-oxononanoate synthase
MTEMDQDLNRRLAAFRADHLYRELRRVDSAQGPVVQADGRELLNFSSNDYLGLANEPALKQAAIRAIERYGAGAGASRLLCGSLAPHHELDEAIAHFKGTQAALSFSSGYATALGALAALADKDAVVVLDKLVHASIVDGARLSGAKLRVFPHNDLDRLEEILKWAAKARGAGSTVRGASPKPAILVVTESVFSMDGDRAPLKELVALKDQHGAWLMLDEAHATGLYGPNRRGLAEEAGVADRIEIQMGTLGKALGAAGGFITGSRALIDFLVNRARSFIFSTAPPPASAAAATAGLRFVQSPAGETRRQHLWERVGQTARAIGLEGDATSAILPLMVGDETKALETAARLREKGMLIPAIRYPTVARGAARLRVTVTASHTSAHIAALAEAMKSIRQS